MRDKALFKTIAASLLLFTAIILRAQSTFVGAVPSSAASFAPVMHSTKPGVVDSPPYTAALQPSLLPKEPHSLVDEITSVVPIPDAIFDALVKAIRWRPVNVLPGNELIVTSLKRSEDWAISTIALKPSFPDEGENILSNSAIVIARSYNGEWHGAIMGTPEYEELLRSAPSSLIRPESKVFLSPSVLMTGQKVQGIGTLLKWPWTQGQTWRYTQRRHGTNNSGIDFAPRSLSREHRYVRASASGVIIRYCGPDRIGQASVAIRHTTGRGNDDVTGYLHLDGNTITKGLGDFVNEGEILGQVYGNGAFSSTCGYGTGPHVHFFNGIIPAGSNDRTKIVPIDIAGISICGWSLGTDNVFRKGNRAISLGQDILYTYDDCGSSPSGDTTPPDGDYTSPSNGATITNSTVHLAAWARDDGSGVKEVHFNAKWNGRWSGLYVDTSEPYEYVWDLCASGVPDGDIELGLEIHDNAGNVFWLHTRHPNPHITKRYNCSPPPPSCTPNADQVALFVDANYSGQCVVKGIGEYSNPDAIGLPNDSISSLKVGSSVRAVLCEHDGFQGTCETFTGNDPSLVDNRIGNDRVSSVKVERRNAPPLNRAPRVPTQLSPPDRSRHTSMPRLCWRNNGDPDGDPVQFWVDLMGAAYEQSGWITDTCWRPSVQAYGTYRWHVQSRDSNGAKSEYSPDWSFSLDQPSPQNRPPRAPTLLSPADGSTHTSMPRLCWRNNGDPDGDPVQFSVDLWTSGRGREEQSGWIAQTCWRPARLSGPGTYFWRVRVRDPRQEGPRSPQWTFHVVDSNAPPFQWKEEAEAGRLTAPMRIGGDADASGCQFVYSPSGWSDGAVTFTFEVPRFGSYSLWARARGLSWNKNSFFVSIDNGDDIRFEIQPRNGQWVWSWQRVLDLGILNHLSAGRHTLRFKAREQGAQLDAVLITNEPGFVPNGRITVCSIVGWRGEYFNNETLSGPPVLVRDDPRIDFEWLDGSPGPGVNRDHFSARWTRKVRFEPGRYRFRVLRDDGVRLWVDDRLILDQWERGREEHVVEHSLAGGEHTVRMEMYEIDGWARASLSWSRLAADQTPPQIRNLRRSADVVNRRGCSSPIRLIVAANVLDQSGLAWVRLYYRLNRGSWRYVDMTNSKGHTYKGTIGPFEEAGTLRFYIKAQDRWGNKGQSAVQSIMVRDCRGRTRPTISRVRRSRGTINQRGCPSPVRLIVAADVRASSGLSWVRLYYRLNGNAWSHANMRRVSGETYKITIGPFDQTGTLSYYVKARDRGGNMRQSGTKSTTVRDCRGQVFGYVFQDVNENEVRDPGEWGFTRAQVQLWSRGSLRETRTPARNGQFAFVGVSPGPYALTVVIPDEYSLTTGDTYYFIADGVSSYGPYYFGVRP